MIGFDIAKNVFEVHGRSAAGAAVHRCSLKRRQVEKFFAKLPKAVIGLEACGSAHHWGRVLGQPGHDVRLMPLAYVKPYVEAQQERCDRRGGVLGGGGPPEHAVRAGQDGRPAGGRCRCIAAATCW